jgi:TRAP transporter 4TM/12TM fusion protein
MSASSHSPRRDAIGGALAVALVAVSLGWVMDLPRRAGLALFAEQPLALSLGLALALCAITCLPTGAGRSLTLAALAASLALLTAMAVVAWRFPQLQILAMLGPAWLTALAFAVIAGLLLLVWRTLGVTIVAIIAVFAAVAIWGGPLGVPETPPDRWAIYMLTDANAILGVPLKVAVAIVIPFVLFGELLRVTGGGDFMTRLCLSAFGRYRGGSAKAAVGASAAFGSISGNAVSNVAGTGVVTIPLMIRSGMPASTAGALEAAASTGGQLLPPVMGAAAFVMADYLRVPYLEVAAAAALPALLYFAALFIQVDRIAAKQGLRPLSRDECPPLSAVARGGAHFVLPFVVLFVVLWRNQTRPELAAVAAIAALVIVSILRPYDGRRLRISMLVAAIVAAGRAAGPLILVTAAAGMIIGMVSVTGLGFSIAADAVAAAGGSLIVLLALVAVIAIVFGMGMPTVAVYVVLATVLAPALERTGLSGMQAHLFILYFGMLSMLTPPVALASITAARIAGADMWATSFRAMSLAWVAYIIPVLFALSPALLLRSAPGASALAALTALLGVATVSVAAAGFARGPIGPVVRVGFALAGVALLLPPDFGLWALAANGGGAMAMTALFVGSRSEPSASGENHRPVAALSARSGKKRRQGC